MRIVFMGTPDFAVATLAKILDSNHEVLAVITAPDKPTGRGLQVSMSAVKKFALENDLAVLQPEKLKSPSFLEELRALQADCFVVVAFRMLPEVVWAMPPKGTINLHGSLLPQYRGAAPIHWAVINGETETGVSTFFIEKEIDTGKIIFQDTLGIGSNETTGEVHDRMMLLGANLVVKTLDAIASNHYPQIDQDQTSTLKPAPKLFKEHSLIDLNRTAQEVHNHIRGMNPFPGAYTNFNNKQAKIQKAQIFEGDISSLSAYSVGEFSILTDGKKLLVLPCADGKHIQILNLQLEGKKRMETEEFLRGYRFF